MKAGDSIPPWNLDTPKMPESGFQFFLKDAASMQDSEHGFYRILNFSP
jgi:hypothetical protein